MFHVSLLIPATDTDGVPHTGGTILDFEIFATELFGAVARIPANDSDPIVYVVALASIEQGGAVVALARYGASLFGRNVRLSYLEQEEVILRR